MGGLTRALRDIAPQTIMALTPGLAYQLVEALPYKYIVRPIHPLDPIQVGRRKQRSFNGTTKALAGPASGWRVGCC